MESLKTLRPYTFSSLKGYGKAVLFQWREGGDMRKYRLEFRFKPILRNQSSMKGEDWSWVLRPTIKTSFPQAVLVLISSLECVNG
jgi:hypothetical protein